MRLIFQLNETCKSTTCPSIFFSDYIPSVKEQGDPELYAKNMAQMMAKELGISVSKLTLKQWDEKRKADREAKALKP